MRIIRSAVGIFLVMLLCLSHSAFAATDIYQLGDSMEDFTVTTYDDQTITLSEVLKEKDMVLINIWATWCGPCRSEFPYMEQAYKPYQDRIEIIALSSEPTDTKDVLTAFANEMGLTFKVGQDTPDLAAKFGVTGIPTSVIIDRNGTICYIESGAITSADIFARLFDAFVGEEYSESVLLKDIPPMKPTVIPSSEAELAAALQVSVAENPSNPYTWPMVVTEKDGRQVVAASNSNISDSTAEVSARVSAQPGDAIVVTFKTDGEMMSDALSIAVNGQKVKSFTGSHDWMTYAIPVEAAGDYQLTIAYSKDGSNNIGEDCVWIDSIEVVSGEAAQTLLEANPSYPVGDANSLQAINPAAREIIISDPTGLLAAYFGDDCRYFIINDDTAQFHASISSDIDPEVAFLYSNYDRSLTPLSQAMTTTGFVVESGIDSMATTGYEYTNLVIYPDMTSYPVATAMFFRDEANVDSFVKNNLKNYAGATVGSWSYAEAKGGELPVIDDDGLSDYTLRCVDQNGVPVAGVMLQVCDETTCQVFITDAEGLCAFSLAPYAWEVHILRAPNSYAADSTDVVLAPVQGGELLFTLTKE